MLGSPSKLACKCVVMCGEGDGDGDSVSRQGPFAIYCPGHQGARGTCLPCLSCSATPGSHAGVVAQENHSDDVGVSM